MSNRRRSQTRRPVRLEVTPDCDPLVGKALAMVTVSAIEQVYEARFRMPAADAAAAIWRMISEQAAAAAGKV